MAQKTTTKKNGNGNRNGAALPMTPIRMKLGDGETFVTKRTIKPTGTKPNRKGQTTWKGQARSVRETKDGWVADAKDIALNADRKPRKGDPKYSNDGMTKLTATGAKKKAAKKAAGAKKTVSAKSRKSGTAKAKAEPGKKATRRRRAA